jgi:hypothetical protein
MKNLVLVQRTLYKGEAKVVPLITKIEEFNVKPDISLEDKVY